MPEWSLACNGIDAREELLREALCTLGKDYFATRGAAPEATADDVHYPGTYIAGCFNRLKTRLAGNVAGTAERVRPLAFSKRPSAGGTIG